MFDKIVMGPYGPNDASGTVDRCSVVRNLYHRDADLHHTGHEGTFLLQYRGKQVFRISARFEAGLSVENNKTKFNCNNNF